ncbi:MAG: DUF2227 family putative metal-binding protein [Thermoflexales bacterium]
MNGAQHDRVHRLGWLSLTASLSFVAAQGMLPVVDALAMWCGYGVGAALTPDLDLARSRGQSLLRRFPPAYLLAQAYAKAFAHRGVSHWPFIGTLTRFLWFFGPPACAFALLGGSLDLRLALMAFVGLCVADLLHIVCDAIG